MLELDSIIGGLRRLPGAVRRHHERRGRRGGGRDRRQRRRQDHAAARHLEADRPRGGDMTMEGVDLVASAAHQVIEPASPTCRRAGGCSRA